MKTNNPFYVILNTFAIAGFLILHTTAQAATSLMVGTIQFPQSITTIPAIRVYSCGKKIPFQLCEVDHEAKQFMFRIPQITKNSQFYILVSQEIHFAAQAHKNQCLKSNTIDHLKVLPNQAYSFYELTLTDTKDALDKITPKWIIEKKELDKSTGKIPDETIIICYDPFCIDFLSGGSAFELPTITLKSNLIALLGSEKELQTLSNKMLISAIDSDTVHATIKPKYQQKTSSKSHVTLVAPIT